MLTSKNKSAIGIIALHIFFSFGAYQSESFAETKSHAASEYRDLAYTQQQKGNFVDALTAYKKAIAVGDVDSDLMNNLGILYERVGFANDAEDSYLKAIEIDNRYLPAFANLGYLYKKLGQRQKAARYFQVRYESGDPQDPWTEKAKDELVKLDPEYQKRFDHIKEEQIQKQSDELALKILTQKHQEFSDLIERSNAHILKGQSLLQKNDIDLAIAEFDESLKLTPQNPKALQLRQKAMQEIAKKDLKRYSDEAVKMFNAGDSVSAQREIQRMLTTVSSDSSVNPK